MYASSQYIIISINQKLVCAIQFQECLLNIIYNTQVLPTNNMSSITCTSDQHFLLPKAQQLRGGAGKSLAWPTFQCPRLKLIVSLERGSVYEPNCKPFLVTEAETKHVRQHTISTTSTRELSSSFFFLQSKALKEIHAIDRNIRGTCTIVCHRQERGGPV